MSWLSTLKEKSKQIAQLYKNELSEFITNLNEDVGVMIGKTENEGEQQRKSPRNSSTTDIVESGADSAVKTTTLLDILQPYLNQAITNEELKIKIDSVSNNQAKYIQKDPMSLEMLYRNDFRNFEDFMYQCDFDDKVCKEIFNSDPNLQLLLDTVDVKGASEEENMKRLLARIVYSIIYLIEGKSQEKFALELEKNESGSNKGSNSNVVADSVGDASEIKSQVSDQFVVVEDGSSSSHRSSNDTEKIESVSQRDANNLSETDEWQVEDKVFVVESSK